MTAADDKRRWQCGRKGACRWIKKRKCKLYLIILRDPFTSKLGNTSSRACGSVSCLRYSLLLMISKGIVVELGVRPRAAGLRQITWHINRGIGNLGSLFETAVYSSVTVVSPSIPNFKASRRPARASGPMLDASPKSVTIRRHIF